jgi:hypothetical protein
MAVNDKGDQGGKGFRSQTGQARLSGQGGNQTAETGTDCLWGMPEPFLFKWPLV